MSGATMSRGPSTRLATTGRRIAIASMSTSPNASSRVGSTRTSDPASSSNGSEVVDQATPACPARSTSAAAQGCSGPSASGPTSRNATSDRSCRRRSAAARNTSLPLRRDTVPSVPTTSGPAGGSPGMRLDRREGDPVRRDRGGDARATQRGDARRRVGEDGVRRGPDQGSGDPALHPGREDLVDVQQHAGAAPTAHHGLGDRDERVGVQDRRSVTTDPAPEAPAGSPGAQQAPSGAGGAPGASRGCSGAAVPRLRRRSPGPGARRPAVRVPAPRTRNATRAPRGKGGPGARRRRSHR